MNLRLTVCWFKTVGKTLPLKRLLKDCSSVFRQAFSWLPEVRHWLSIRVGGSCDVISRACF